MSGPDGNHGRCLLRSRRPAEPVLEAVLLLAGSPLEAPGVAALDQRREDAFHVRQRLDARHPFGASLELTGRLRAPEQQYREHRQLLAPEAETFFGEVAVLGRAAAVTAGKASQAVARGRCAASLTVASS